MLANCPCQFHTKTRGYDWVVFRRQPDRTPTLYYEQTESESEEDTEDEIQEQYDEEEDYFSMEHENDENQENQDAMELLAQSLLGNQLINQPRTLNLKIKHLYTPGKKRRMKKKRSQRRSPLKEMMKIWNPRILMTLMYKKIQQEEETISYVSNL